MKCHGPTPIVGTPGGRQLGVGLLRSRHLGFGSSGDRQLRLGFSGDRQLGLGLSGGRQLGLGWRGVACPDVLKDPGSRVSLPVAHYSDTREYNVDRLGSFLQK